MTKRREGSVDGLVAALCYAELGWHVFPVLADKSPATRHGFKDATSDPDKIRELWRSTPGSGVGIRTGAESRLVVLDIDPLPGGDETLAQLETRYGDLPETVEVLTGGGGRHLYFNHPGGTVRCSAGKLAPGLDIRADGGYVVAPPSQHESGRAYEWEVSHRPEDTELAEAPSWIYETAADEQQTEDSRSGAEAIEEGRRNVTLATFAGSMRRRGMTEAEIAAALLVMNRDRCRPPLDEAEVERIAASIARYEPTDPIQHEVDAGEREPLSVITARAVFELPDPPASSVLVGPLLTKGSRTVLGAQTGEGKTTLALQLVHAAVTGGDFLGWKGAGCRALVIDAEQGLRTIKRRLNEAGLADSTEVHYLRAPDGLALDDAGPDADELGKILADGDYGLVIADPLYKLHRGDSNEERHAVDLMRRFDAWRTEFGFALLLLVHRRKTQHGAGGRFTMDDLFGSSAYLRGAEVVLGLRRLSPGYSKLHFFKDRDGDLPVGADWGLLFDTDEGFRRDPEDGKPKETAIDKVKASLESEPGQTKKKLAAAAGCSERTVQKALKDLDAEYESGPSGSKLWRLPRDQSKETDS